ncbi:hypothetical protein GCM10027596_26780 [Nocardioides korecus]
MTTAPDDSWTTRITNPQLPLWMRVAAYAEAHANRHGHCPLTPEQLHRGIDPTLPKSSISEAIRRAITVRWLDPASTARCLILAGYNPADPRCPATHRTGA